MKAPNTNQAIKLDQSCLEQARFNEISYGRLQNKNLACALTVLLFYLYFSSGRRRYLFDKVVEQFLCS